MSEIVQRIVPGTNVDNKVLHSVAEVRQYYRTQMRPKRLRKIAEDIYVYALLVCITLGGLLILKWWYY